MQWYANRVLHISVTYNINIRPSHNNDLRKNNKNTNITTSVTLSIRQLGMEPIFLQWRDITYTSDMHDYVEVV